VDPAAASLKIALRQSDLPVLDANNDVLLGIKICSKFIGGKNIVIQKGCTTLREHLQSYAWDSKAADRGEDKPVKKDDHICVTGETLVLTSDGEISIKNLSFDPFQSTYHAMSYKEGFGYFPINQSRKTRKNSKI